MSSAITKKLKEIFLLLVEKQAEIYKCLLFEILK